MRPSTVGRPPTSRKLRTPASSGSVDGTCCVTGAPPIGPSAPLLVARRRESPPDDTTWVPRAMSRPRALPPRWDGLDDVRAGAPHDPRPRAAAERRRGRRGGPRDRVGISMHRSSDSVTYDRFDGNDALSATRSGMWPSGVACVSSVICVTMRCDLLPRGARAARRIAGPKGSPCTEGDGQSGHRSRKGCVWGSRTVVDALSPRLRSPSIRTDAQSCRRPESTLTRTRQERGTHRYRACSGLRNG